MAVAGGKPLARVAPAQIGLGLFAAKSIGPGETIMRINGRIVHHSVLWRRQGTKFSANCLRYGPETYLDPGDEPGRYINHSCDPNAGLRKINNRLFLFAAKRIAVGSEITFDYSTTIGDDDIWTMRCKCGSVVCRKTIRNLGSLPDELKRSYVSNGLVPSYIMKTLTERIAGG
ncbi:MAG: SET domain-containing protein-lysine N-methyltransferase [Gemmatimonadales bacterium]